MKSRNVLAAALAVTCAGIGYAGPYTIGVPMAAWKTPVLNACWQSSRTKVSREVGEWAKMNFHAEVPTDAFQAEFKSWVTGAYTVGRVGIGFSGFGPCPDDEASLAKYPVYLVNDMKLFTGFLDFFFGKGAVIGISVIGDRSQYEPALNAEHVAKPSSVWPGSSRKATGAKAAVGFDLDSSDKFVDAYFSRVDAGIERSLGLDPAAETPTALQKYLRTEAAKEALLQRADSRKFTVLHELGHLVGLLHEDRRKDAAGQRPKYCLNVAGDHDLENDGTFGETGESRFGTQYDPFSIMSYCRETMHRLYHQAKLVCRIAPKLDDATRAKISGFLKNCDELAAMSFPVDLTLRDITALRAMYLKEAPRKDEWVDFRRSTAETRLFEILNDSAALPFDENTAKAMQ